MTTSNRLLSRATLAFVLLALAACGGDDDSPGAADAAVDARVILDVELVPDAPPADAAPDARLPDGGVSPFVCDPVHQTGCGAGQKCDLGANGTFGCVANGTLDDFRVCDPTQPNACLAGFTCRGTNFGDNRCARLCTVAEQDELCRSNEPCTSVRTTSDGHEYRMCKSPNACNPVLDDCADAALQCTWSEPGAFCLAPGNVSDGSTCTSSAQCKRGSSCLPGAVGQPRKCFHLCDPEAATSSCAAAAACTFFATIGPQHVGACGYTLP